MKFIPVAVTRFVAKTALQTQQNAPTILFGAGVVGFVATAVLSGKATLKMDTILDEHEVTLAGVKHLPESENYNEQDRTKDKALVYTNTTIAVVKAYGPTILVGAASLACFAQSHRILTKRNAVLLAAYTALEKGFRDYRRRVIKDVGLEKDRDYLAGVEERIEQVMTPKGKTKEVTNKVHGKDVADPYTFIFDDFSKSWSDGPGYNQAFLAAQEQYANSRLNSRGYVFLNDILDALGIERVPHGQIVGWLKDNPEADGYIDFGIFDGDILMATAFVNGDEKSVWLNFNCDGVIVNKI